MFEFSFRRTFRRAAFILAATLATIAATLTTPALAIDGRNAVGICIDNTANGAHCAWSVNDKGEIDICNKSGCVYCASATAECTAAKGRARPTSSLPVGTTVKTAVGTLSVTKNPPFTGSIASSNSCPTNLVRCLSRCINPNTTCELKM
jgi:hypothetical protein